MARRDTKTQILEAACEAFREYGYQKVSLNDIARAAEVSRQTIYIHFGDKETLFQANFEFEMSRNLAQATEILETTAEPLEALTEVFGVWHGQYVKRYRRLRAGAEQPTIQLSGARFIELRAAFIALLSDYISTHPAISFAANDEVSAYDAAETLVATSLGLHGFSSSEVDYLSKMKTAIRTILKISKT
ncbi:TetR/AcrR family transcriptional regulator [Cognatishimia activa]|uniref:TetR/AcrR family transcriptional regulator n=1 Tax=Cognatishimia activa TaxID=1715691 RepID=UPI002230299F|nr:TetR/AcrR family transcriptional regulator [Cognatishimia activa]UZD89727.1 TetR/AcrR family transcriptional regulator [Cognatishimia activa]